MKVELLEEGTTHDPVMSIAKAASECYDSQPSVELLGKVLRSGHTSMAEHCLFHFRVSEVSRVLTHQLVRKRIGVSYAQRSQRYVNEYNFDYVLPRSIRETSFKDQYTHLLKDIGELYQAMVDEGIPKEDARFILPNATHTSIHVTINLRALIDLAYERLCSRTQCEIRLMVTKMKDIISKRWSELGQYIVPKCEQLGYCPEHDSCNKMIKKNKVRDLYKNKPVP